MFSVFFLLFLLFGFSSRKINVNVQLSDPNELKTQTRMKATVHTLAVCCLAHFSRATKALASSLCEASSRGVCGEGDSKLCNDLCW